VREQLLQRERLFDYNVVKVVAAGALDGCIGLTWVGTKRRSV